MTMADFDKSTAIGIGTAISVFGPIPTPILTFRGEGEGEVGRIWGVNNSKLS